MWTALENIGSWNLNTYKWLLKNRRSPWKNTHARAHIWTRTRIQRNNEELTQSQKIWKTSKEMQLNTVFELTSINPIKPRGRGAIFARGKFKFKLFLNELQYEPETPWLFLTLTRDQKKNNFFEKNIKFSGCNIFIYRGYCKKKSSPDM